VGDSTQIATYVAQVGKTTVQNNYLSWDKAHAFDKEMTPGNISGFFGDVGGSVFSETTVKGAEAVVNKVKEKYEKNNSLAWAVLFILFSMLSMTFLSLFGYFLFAFLLWMVGGELDFNIVDIIIYIKISFFGGGVVGFGVVLMKLLKVKGF